jgi:hypothetical protein
MDWCGRLWALVELKACLPGLCGQLWTPTDTPWTSTDQEVGGSSPSGLATDALAQRGPSSRNLFLDPLTLGSQSWARIHALSTASWRSLRRHR